MNGPIAANKQTLSEADIDKIIKGMTADSTAENKAIFAPKDANVPGMFKKEGNERYVEVSDDFYDEIKEMNK